MTFHAYHGLLEQERLVGNTYTVDLKIHADFSRAALSDNVEDTVNYASVYEVVKQEMRTPSNLIEHVARRIVRQVHAAFPLVERVEIRLAKKNPPFGGDIKEAAVVYL